MLLNQALVRTHHCIGLVTAPYVLLMCVTGSLLVYRAEIERTARPVIRRTEQGPLLSADELRRAAQDLYPGWTLTRVPDAPQHAPYVEIWLERNGEERARLFNPVTGEDMGDFRPPTVAVMYQIERFHNELWLGPIGLAVHGVASMLVTVMALTGLLAWSPHRHRWRPLALFRFAAFATLLMWSSTAVYFADPGLVSGVIERLSDSGAPPGSRLGDRVVALASNSHFGRRSPWTKAVTVSLGLFTAMGVTSCLGVWWRGVRPRV